MKHTYHERVKEKKRLLSASLFQYTDYKNMIETSLQTLESEVSTYQTRSVSRD